MNTVGGDVARLVRVFPGETASLEEARAAVVGFLLRHDPSDVAVELARLVVSELATNAVQFAPGADYAVHVEVDSSAAKASVGVRSAGTASDIPSQADMATAEGDSGPLALRGRGLAIVRTVSDEVRVHDHGDDTVSVTASFGLD